MVVAILHRGAQIYINFPLIQLSGTTYYFGVIPAFINTIVLGNYLRQSFSENKLEVFKAYLDQGALGMFMACVCLQQD